jgi:hypothetical protein
MNPQTPDAGTLNRRAQRWNELTLILIFLSSGFYSGVSMALHSRHTDTLETVALFLLLAATTASFLIWLAKVRGRQV